MRKKIKKYRNEFSSCVFFLFEYMFVLFWYNMLISQSWTLRHVSRPKTNKWIPVKTEHCSHCQLYTITCQNRTLHPLPVLHNYKAVYSSHNLYFNRKQSKNTVKSKANSNTTVSMELREAILLIKRKLYFGVTSYR